MNINRQEIKEKYPKSYEKFINSGIIQSVMTHKNIRFRDNFLKALCYCNYEKFFDDNGIIIETTVKIYNTNWIYKIKTKRREQNWRYKIVNIKYRLTSRDEAKEQAIYKAFEIMESTL